MNAGGSDDSTTACFRGFRNLGRTMAGRDCCGRHKRLLAAF